LNFEFFYFFVNFMITYIFNFLFKRNYFSENFDLFKSNVEFLLNHSEVFKLITSILLKYHI
jgi:hypothetical protein